MITALARPIMADRDLSKAISAMSDQELHDFEVPTAGSIEELAAIIEALAGRRESYSACVHAMSAAAVATIRYLEAVIRPDVSGWPSNLADLDILRRTRQLHNGFAIIDYNNLLYPQYLKDTAIPGWGQLINGYLRVSLRRQAARLLREEHDGTSSQVLAHWQRLLSDEPF